MKKWLSLVLTLVLLVSAVPALAAPYDIAFLSTAKDWAMRVNPSEADYVADLAVLDTEVARGTLRAGNGITELKVETPAFLFADPETEPEYTEVALLQYAENGLAVKMGDQTWLIDVNAILNFLIRKNDYTKDAVKADASLVKSLLVRFVTEVLNPTISWNLATGSATLHFDVNQDQFADRMPAFLDGLDDQEEAINALLVKYGAEFALATLDYQPTLAGIRATWTDYMEKTSNQVPAFTLQADAAIALPKADQPLQVGLTGTFCQGKDTCIFSAEYLPKKEGFLAMADFGGMRAGQIYSYSLEAHADATSIDVDITTADKETNLYNFFASKENETVEVSGFAYSVTNDQLSELIYERGYDLETGDLVATLTRISGPLADQQETELCKLTATVQEKGIIGTISLGDHYSAQFTWTTAPLYYRLFLTAYVDQTARGEADLWLFPQGADNYRYRASYRTIDAASLSNHYLATGTFNPSAFTLAVSEVGGDTLLDLSLVYAKEDNAATATGTCVVLTPVSQINICSVLALEGKLPASFDTDVTVNSRDGQERLNVYRLSWIPGEVTYVDGVNYYSMVRAVNTEKELTYNIVRNHTVELGMITAALSEEDELSLKVDWKDFANFAISAKSVVAEPVEEVIEEEPPVVIGVFDGTMDADGMLHGIVTQMVEEEAEEEAPAAEPLKIEPMDLTNATVIDVKYVLRNYLNYLMQW